MSWPRRALVAPSLMLAFQLVAVPAGAQVAPDDAAERQEEIAEEIRRLQEAVGEASAAEGDLIRRLSEVQGRLDTIDGRIGAIDGDLGAANTRLAAAQARVEKLDGRYLELTARLRATARAIDVAEDDVSDVAVEMYQRAGTDEAGFTSAVLDADDPDELFAGTRYLAATAEAGQERIDELVRLEARVEDLRGALDDQRQEAEAARDEVAAERSHIAALRDEQERARAEVNLAAAEQRDLLDEVRARQAEFESEIAALQAESESIASLLRSRGVSSAFPDGPGALVPPVSAPITSVYGMRHHPILGYSRMHTGVDFGAAAGTPIRAAGAGEVVEAGTRGGYGTTVIIDHGGGIATLYAHQSGVNVSAGETVGTGETVGWVGSTGMSTGPHLHFEVRVDGVPVDPLSYL